ncbi:M20/M25/M40 family metallo-hydrolase [Sorangium sp. So ce327]|uniref:M20/M25/M40 family metallo-hydrolase n=1 Tax=Sorangium sp. So ce327 TaxID=3133301 RepID=UPI003F6268A9
MTQAPILTAPDLAPADSQPSRANLRSWVELLSAESLRGRAAGTEDSARVARLLAAYFASLGLRAALPEGDYCQPFERSSIRDQNVVAFLPAPIAGEEAPVVIVGAHYDALGSKTDGTFYPGADDNASGVAALLELARLVRAPRVNVLLVAFGAEERGLLGSKFFVEHPVIPLKRVALMINLDMVGRQLLEGKAIRWLLGAPHDAMGFIISERGRQRTQELLASAGKATRTPLFGLPESIVLQAGFASDSVPFSAHVPTLFLSTSLHDDYHEPSDTVDKIDDGQMARAVALVFRILNAIDDSP